MPYTENQQNITGDQTSEGTNTSHQPIQSGYTARLLPAVGFLLGETWRILKSRFWKFLLLKLFAFIPVIVLIFVFLTYAASTFGLNVLVSGDTTSRLAVLSSVINIFLGVVGLIALLLIFIFLLWGKAAELIYLRDLEQESNIKPAIKEGWHSLWSLAGVYARYGLWLILGFILLIIPSIYFYYKYLFAPYAYIFEKAQGTKGGRAMRRGFELINGYRWGVLAKIIIVSIILLVINLGYQLIQQLITIFALSGESLALLVLMFVVLTLLGSILGLAIQSFSTIFKFRLFVYTYQYKQEAAGQPVYHPFSTIKKILIIILILLFTLGPIIVLGALTSVSLREARTRASDAKVISDIQQIRTALELYRVDNGGYPAGQAAVLGEDNYRCLDNTGFHAVCSGSIYLSLVPHPTDSRDKYIYTMRSGRQDYEIIFNLKEDSGGYTKGERRATATSQGIDGQKPVEDIFSDKF